MKHIWLHVFKQWLTALSSRDCVPSTVTRKCSQVFNMVLIDFNLPVGESHTFAGLFTGRNKLSSTKIEIIVWMMVRLKKLLFCQVLEFLFYLNRAPFYVQYFNFDHKVPDHQIPFSGRWLYRDDHGASRDSDQDLSQLHPSIKQRKMDGKYLSSSSSIWSQRDQI